jgi:sugar phosphate isomerase/epimerase
LQFGLSTHLFHGQRLTREHLLEVAASGFAGIELFATRTHFDYHNPAAIADLQQWLGEAGLVLAGIHGPIGEGYLGGRWSGPLSLANADAEVRGRALAESERALHIARRIPVGVMVTHLGIPRSQLPGPGENGRDAARRSLDALAGLAEPLGVRIAVEVLPNELSRPGSLVHLVETDLEARDVGICLDLGHAHLEGDVVDAIETVSEHLIATHVDDNRGRADDHLLPFEGTIDWPAAMTALQKVGYEASLTFEVGARGSARETLRKAQRARERIEKLLAL